MRGVFDRVYVSNIRLKILFKNIFLLNNRVTCSLFH